MKKWIAVLISILLFVWVMTLDSKAQTFGSGWSLPVNVYQGWVKPATASTSGKATQFDLGTTGALAGLVQTDYPRDLALEFSAAVTAANITVVGKDGRGNNKTEILTGIDDEQTNNAWSQVTSITVNSCTGGTGKTLDIGWGVKFGLNNSITSSASVYKTVMDSGDVATASATISSAYGTITFATAPNGTHYYEIYYTGN